MKEIKIKLVSIKEPKEQLGVIKDIDYAYSIEDSVGLLGITLTMYNEIDPVEEFVRQMPHLYQYNIPVQYDIYYKNYKYISYEGNIRKVKMW